MPKLLRKIFGPRPRRIDRMIVIGTSEGAWGPPLPSKERTRKALELARADLAAREAQGRDA